MKQVTQWVAEHWGTIVLGALVVAGVLNRIVKHYGNERPGLKRTLLFILDLISPIVSRDSDKPPGLPVKVPLVTASPRAKSNGLSKMPPVLAVLLCLLCAAGCGKTLHVDGKAFPEAPEWQLKGLQATNVAKVTAQQALSFSKRKCGAKGESCNARKSCLQKCQRAATAIVLAIEWVRAAEALLLAAKDEDNKVKFVVAAVGEIIASVKRSVEALE